MDALEATAAAFQQTIAALESAEGPLPPLALETAAQSVHRHAQQAQTACADAKAVWVLAQHHRAPQTPQRDAPDLSAVFR